MMSAEVKDHDHFFSPKIDKYEGDVLGRFDAVLDASDKAWVFVAEAGEWFPVDSYDDACALARECAEAW